MKKLLLVALTILGAQSLQATQIVVTQEGLTDASGEILLSQDDLALAGIQIPSMCIANAPACQNLSLKDGTIVTDDGTTIISRTDLATLFDHAIHDSALAENLKDFVTALHPTQAELSDLGLTAHATPAAEEGPEYDFLGTEWRWLELSDTTK